LEAAHLEVAHF
jgi:uncharacterized protein YjbI with pentapeptide repeats